MSKLPDSTTNQSQKHSNHSTSDLASYENNQSKSAPTLTKIFTKKEWLLLFSMAFIQFSHIVDFMIMMPLGPQLMRLFEITPHQFGLLVSAYTFAAAATGLAAAFFADRFDRKQTLLFFYVGFCVSTLACAIAENYHALLISRLLSGAFGGVLGSLTLSIVSDGIHYTKRSTAIGIVMTSFSVASIFGVPFSLYLAQLSDWHAPFMFLGVVSLLLIGMISISVPKMREHLKHRTGDEKPWTHVLNILRNSNQVISLAFMMSLVFGQFAIIPFLSPSLVANAGLSEPHLPLIYLVGGICSIIAGPTIGRAADLYGKKRIFSISLLASLIPFAIITNLGPTPLHWTLLAVALFFISMSGRVVPAQSLVASTVHPQNRGSFMSLLSSCSSLAMALASYLAGLIIQKSPTGELEHYNLVGLVALAFSLISLWFVRYIKVVEGDKN